MAHFVRYPEKQERYGIENMLKDGVSNKEHFYRKILQKMCTES